MPSHRIFKNLGLHRQAGTALYRALLRQCRAVPLPESSQSTLQNVVRNRFWAHRNQAGPRFIKLAFNAGYKALDLLDTSAAGDQASTKKITSYLTRIPKSVRSPPNKTPRPGKRRQHGTEAFEPPPEKKFLANFPRSENKVPQGRRFRDEDGIRKVPFLVNSQGFPFIRVNNYQPKNLSRVLRQKRDKYWQRSNIVQFIEDYFQPLAEYEDAWDRQLQQDGLIRPGDAGKEGSFLKEMEDAYREARNLWYGMRDQQVELAAKMRTIVQTERQLAEEERARAVKKGLIKDRPVKKDWPTSQW